MMQLLNDAAEVTVDLCQIQTNDLVVSNPVSLVSTNAHFTSIKQKAAVKIPKDKSKRQLLLLKTIAIKLIHAIN
jgi:hypothetical protein